MGFNPKELNLDVNSMHDVLVQYVAEKKLTPDDLLRTFISRWVCPLQTRVHKICHMSGLLDPTRVSRNVLTKAQVLGRMKAIARSNMVDTWEWGVEPFERDRRAPNVSFCFLALPEFLGPGYFYSEVLLFRGIVTLFSPFDILSYPSCRDSCARKSRMVRIHPSTGMKISLPRRPE